jgi:ELWxxDGT repeat protein
MLSTWFIEYSGKLIFMANDSAHGSELWVTDGTALGTHILKDITTTPLFFKIEIIYNLKKGQRNLRHPQ